MNDRELKRNGSGYFDPTAYGAIENINRGDTFRKLMRIILNVCELSDFKVDGRIRLVDKKTGRVWK